LYQGTDFIRAATKPSPAVILSVTERRRREVESKDSEDAYRNFAESGSSTQIVCRPDARLERRAAQIAAQQTTILNERRSRE
jgi:hypothetical protein